jgi:hypothetical protein
MPYDCNAEEGQFEEPSGTANVPRLNDCCVCLEELNSGLAALSCGHVLHSVCVRMLLTKTRTKTCPQCRTPFSTVVPLFFHIPSGYECKERPLLDNDKTAIDICERAMAEDPVGSRHGPAESGGEDTLLSFLNARLGDVEAQLSDAQVRISRHEATIATLRDHRREAAQLARKLDEKTGECAFLQRELDRLRETHREENETLRMELRKREAVAFRAQQCEKRLLEELESLRSLRLAAEVRRIAEEMDSSHARGWYESLEDISETRGLLVALDTRCRGMDRELETARMECKRLGIKTERLEKSLFRLERMNRKENRELPDKSINVQHRSNALSVTALDSILLGDDMETAGSLESHGVKTGPGAGYANGPGAEYPNGRDIDNANGRDIDNATAFHPRPPLPQPPPLIALKKTKHTPANRDDYASDGRGGQVRVVQLRNGDRLHL